MAKVVELQKENAEFVNFTLRTNGRVSGKIFGGEGVSPGGIAVNLLPLEYRNSADPHPMKTVSDATGAYYFEGVPEGRYLLGINLDGSVQRDSRYLRFYYGDTTDPDGTLAHSETLQIPASVNVDLRFDLVPAKRPQNLVLNADAGEGFEGWSTSGATNIESSAGCDASLVVRGGGYFQQFVHLPQGSVGQYAVSAIQTAAMLKRTATEKTHGEHGAF